MKHGTTMALTASSLAAAPLFITPTDTPKMTAQTPASNPALRGTLTSANAGMPKMMRAVSLGGAVMVVAGMGQRRQRMKTSVCAADSKSAPKAAPETEETEADETPPPPPPPPPP